MITVVTGGSGSGKSAYAEKQIALTGIDERFYIATMENRDAESQKRIDRHRQMRADKHFETLECPRDLHLIDPHPDAVVLLECMSNLTANELFSGNTIAEPEQIILKIKKGIDHLCESFHDTVIVTNEVFSDGASYDEWTLKYLFCLGEMNRYLSSKADRVVEVVYTIPVIQKG